MTRAALLGFGAVALLACEPVVFLGDRAAIGGAGAPASGTGGTMGGVAPTGGVDTGSPVPWVATHELGTLGEWLDDQHGWQNERRGSIAVSTEQARAGRHALRLEIATDGTGESQAVLGRDVELETGRYGAWYFFPTRPTTDFWVIMKVASWGAPRIERFDLDVGTDAAQIPRLFLFEHGVGAITELAATPLPIGRWVHLELRYRATPDSEGRVMVLQDDAVVLDTGLRATAAHARVSWSVGSIAQHVDPSPILLYLDDAALARDELAGRRIGETCYLLCASAATDPDGDGWGWEHEQSCLVSGSAPFATGTACGG